MVKKIILVFKTHFDIGFTDLSSKVIKNYSDSMLKEVISTCKATQNMGKLKYIWTMPSWPLKVITQRCSKDLKEEVDLLIERGQIVWHALPFTSHTDFCSAEDYIEGLRFGRELSETYHKPYVISAKMTDVPGHGIMLPAILYGAGIKFLHLGCNEFANPPKLPFLFWWQAASGERILTMYSKGGYGTPLLPPKDWKYPVWMSLMQTHDNCGPQSAAVIEKLVKTIKDSYPEAEVVCGTMDEFYKDLAEYGLDDLPVVKKDLADTWIHGIGAYPKEVGIIRENREKAKRLQAVSTKQLFEACAQSEDKITGLLDKYYENVCLFEEHTWGADVKTWLGPDRVYEKNEFLEAKQQKNYKFMETSWQEQRERAVQSSQALHELKAIIEGKKKDEFSIFNPNNCEFTGWVSLKELNWDFNNCGLELDGSKPPLTKINGEFACFVSKIPPFKTVPIHMVHAAAPIGSLHISKDRDDVIVQNHRYRLKFSGSAGNITEIYDKKLGTILLKQKNDKAVFSYQYDRYGIEDVTNYLKDYAYRFSTWGIKDYGREAYPECEHKIYYPAFKSFVIENDTIIFHYENTESAEKYGDAEKVIVEVTLPPDGEEFFVTLRLKNKQETPYIESGSILLPYTEETTQFRVNKSNVVLNPASDIQEDANHVFYCIENYISAMDSQNGLCVITEDSPLASLGNTGIYRYMNDYKAPEEPVIYFNLFNNMWGTNFPQWIGGDLTYRYTLYGFRKDEEAYNLERAAVLKEGVEITGNHLIKDFGRFPEHMQLVNVRKYKDGIILRFKDLSGENASRKLQVNDYYISAVDLQNRETGDRHRGEYHFDVKPYGIYSFLLSKNSGTGNLDGRQINN